MEMNIYHRRKAEKKATNSCSKYLAEKIQLLHFSTGAKCYLSAGPPGIQDLFLAMGASIAEW
jgi:hypothetical protein